MLFKTKRLSGRPRGLAYLLFITITSLYTLAHSADHPFIKYTQGPTLADHKPDQLLIQFTGAGGVYMAFNNESLLGDPFYSNPSLSDLILLNDLKPNIALIDQYLPPLDQVKGALIGHGHYDHLMDLPYVLGKLPAPIKAYGSLTMAHLLASAFPPSRLVALNNVMANPSTQSPGEWVQVTPTLRFMAIKSEHSPHIAGKVFASDQIVEPLAEMPKDALDWQSGVSLSYLIDWLDSAGKPIQRVFYQTSASSAPVGFAPDHVLADGKRIDAAILCVANFQKSKDYPMALLKKLQPRRVIPIHWEKFWDDYQPGTGEPLSDSELHEFLLELEKGGFVFHLLQRGSWISL